MDTVIFMKWSLLVFVLLMVWQMYDFKKQTKGK
jgi:hypothetical protein